MTATNREALLPFQKDFSAEELSSRRKKVMQAMGSGVAVLTGATDVPGFDPIRQNNDFYYLTGVEVPHAYLTMDADSGKSVLYLPPRDKRHEKTDGPNLCDSDGEFVLKRTLIDEVRPVAQITEDMKTLKNVWVMRAPGENYRQCQDTLRHYTKCINEDPMDGRPSRETHLMTRIAQLAPTAEFRDLSPIVHVQRLTKSPAELEVMRKAAFLSALACVEAMKTTRPGLYEFQLGALADYFFQINGAQGAGYRPIIAAGAANTWMMHYWRNNSQMKDGDLVIFDYAPEYNYYTSDIGRMWPVNGKYSPLQRELYGFVVEHHKTLLSSIRPGKMKGEVLAEAAAKMRPVVEKWNWSKPIYKAGALKLLESDRPLSHAVGMSVHEATHWAPYPIQAGLVFTVDPELVIPEEELYLRIEDTVVVTEDGIENLTVSAPTELDDCERIMKEPAILQQFPAVMQNPSR